MLPFFPVLSLRLPLVADYTLAVVVPGHMYLGGRSVLVDYVPDQGYQRLAIGTLGVLSAVTAIGLLKLNITDVGITEAVRTLWRSSPN